ncbi:MAG TPA: phosphatase PAP2 family protein [Gemmatimonadales bacterium]|nr:phosphatase PAP2 family protein [Gemmatimonadales bacterium]
MSWRPVVLAAGVVFGRPAAVSAQLDTLASIQTPSVIRWWHGAIVVAGISALMLVDEPAQRYFQDHRSASSDDLASTLRHFGQPEVYGTVTLGLVGAGLLTHNDELTRAGGRLAASLFLAGGTTGVAKYVFGRSRPSETTDAHQFDPFSGNDAFPSGHTTVAFALATALSDDIHRIWASIGLYTLATGVGWSRLNDNKHWLSDVAAGAVVGITSAKLMNGHWRIFNLHPPRVLIGPRHAGLAWQVPF